MKAQANKGNSSGPPVVKRKGSTVMRKRKRSDQILGQNPWDVEAALAPADHDARAQIIITYMHNGDLRPLAAAISEGRSLHPDVLDFMASMIREGRLAAKPRGRGKRFQPSKVARDRVAALFHARGWTFEQVANKLCMSEAAVRKAVTHWRKNAK
jgi:hypothetical protein